MIGVSNFVQKIKEKLYFFWRGRTIEETIRHEWYNAHVNPTAATIKTILFGFKYIIELDYDKVYNDLGITLEYQPGVQSFLYPARENEDCTVLYHVRGIWMHGGIEFQDNAFGDTDALFAGTNNKEDAIMLALKYS